MIESSVYTTPLTGSPYYTSAGIIKAVDQQQSEFPIAEIRYERFDDQNYQYVFLPFWNLLEHLPTDVFQGIPGIDMDMQKERYYRVNMTPSFIEMRTPGPGREDLQELLDNAGLDYYDRFEWLLRSKMRCGDDNLIVVRKRSAKDFSLGTGTYDLNELLPGDRVSVDSLQDFATKNSEFVYVIRRVLSSGADIYITGEKRHIDNQERRAMLYLLGTLSSYEKDRYAKNRAAGIKRAKGDQKYTGRKRIPVDPIMLRRIGTAFRNGQLTESEAMNRLGIGSRSTFYRRLREI